MPNKNAKLNKQKRKKLNDKWKREGRTSKQYQRFLAKQDSKNRR